MGRDGKRFPVRLDCAADAQGACRDVSTASRRVRDVGGLAAMGTAAGRRCCGWWSASGATCAATRRAPDRAGAEAPACSRAGRPGGRARAARPARRRSCARSARAPGWSRRPAPRGQQPTWVVTGIDDAGSPPRAALSEARLRDRFAVAVENGRESRLPLPVRRRRRTRDLPRRPSPLHAARASVGSRTAWCWPPSRCRSSTRSCSPRCCSPVLLAGAGAGVGGELRAALLCALPFARAGRARQPARRPRGPDGARAAGERAPLGKLDVTLEALAYGAVPACAR